MSTVESLNTFQQLASVRLVAASNQSGTYFNGPTNSGVGATFTYAPGVLTIDSVVANINDYILFAGQTSAYENGIWQVIQLGNGSVGAILQRRGDFQSIEQIHTGHYVPVSAGTIYAGAIWTVVEPLPAAIGVPIVSGSNNINFTTSVSSGSSLYLPLAGGTLTGDVVFNKGTATTTAGEATVNHQVAILTTPALTTAGGSSYVITLTNSLITTSSGLLATLMGGTNTATENLSIVAVAGTGSATITIYNNTASTALNGTLILCVEVL